ncbi:hypothetical protein [Nocardioides sp.]|uniref:hypothetical protein n=1 Tax=Nocardioides sp. TaxID=35761 RepID=UPI0035152A92
MSTSTASSTATTGTVPGAARPHPATDGERAPGFRAVLVSEWLKFATLRSSWITLGSATAVMVLIGVIAAAAVGGDTQAPGGPTFDASDPMGTVLTGANFAVLILGVLGALSGSREYGSRMIATSFIATPRRGRVIVAKALVLVAVVVPAGLVGSVGAFLAGNAVLDAAGEPSLGLGDAGVVGDLVGMAGWFTAVTLIGLGLGLLLRSVAASVGTLIGGVLIAPPIVGALLPDGADRALQVLPSNAAAALTVVQATGDVTIGAATGAAILVGWVALVLGTAARAVLVRDV